MLSRVVRLLILLSFGFLLRHVSSILVRYSYTSSCSLYYSLLMYHCFHLHLAMKLAYTFPVFGHMNLVRTSAGRSDKLKLVSGLTYLAGHAWLTGSSLDGSRAPWLLSINAVPSLVPAGPTDAQSSRRVDSTFRRCLPVIAKRGHRSSGNGSKNNWRCSPAAFIPQLESRLRTHALFGL